MRTEAKAWSYGTVGTLGIFGGLLLGRLVNVLPGVVVFVVGMAAAVLWTREERRRQRELTGLDQTKLADLWRAGRKGRAPEDPQLDRVALVWADDRLKRLTHGVWFAPVVAVLGGVVGYFTGFPKGLGWPSAVYWALLGVFVLVSQIFQRKRVSRMRAEIEKRASGGVVDGEVGAEAARTR
ncbi:hypothetical protein [Actinomadura hibisca]|uniref:hypothetical protein n=1 Tax=Actinomadura hibisca TaxID=68565 RepID=UPI00083511D2|nr:hypothetical protein [Actinomadura hibisca]